MNQPILYIFQIVLTTRSPQIPILVEVPLQVSIDRGGHRETPYVELTWLVQQRPFTVLLNNIASLAAIDMRVIDDLFDLGKVTANCDAAAAVRILSGFQNPKVFAHTWVLLKVRVILGWVVGLFKFMESRIGQAILNVVSQRQVIKSWLACRVVVAFHIVVDSLLVR